MNSSERKQLEHIHTLLQEQYGQLEALKGDIEAEEREADEDILMEIDQALESLQEAIDRIPL